MGWGSAVVMWTRGPACRAPPKTNERHPAAFNCGISGCLTLCFQICQVKGAAISGGKVKIKIIKEMRAEVGLTLKPFSVSKRLIFDVRFLAVCENGRVV